MTLAEKIAARKAERAAAQPTTLPTPGKPRGLVLSSKAPELPIRPPTPAPESDERSLGLTQGQAIDMTPVDALPQTRTWHQALNAFESELVVTNDPLDPTHSWLAVFPKGVGYVPPILIHRLQFFEHPSTQRPANHPF
jgi:hypothetical protein